MTWGAPIWIYLWLAGTAGGGYFAAFWAKRFYGDESRPLLKLATCIGIPLAVTGVLLLIACTGVLLAASSQSPWSGTFLLPALFVVSAVSTGIALNRIAAGGSGELKIALNQIFGSESWTTSNHVLHRLAEADAGVIILELLVLVGYVIWLAVSSTAGAAEALTILVAGQMAAAIWIEVVLLALPIPPALDLQMRGKALTADLWHTVLVSVLCVITGGLILRAVITIGGQIWPDISRVALNPGRGREWLPAPASVRVALKSVSHGVSEDAVREARPRLL